MKPSLRVALSVGLLTCAASVLAAATAGQFAVNIQLNGAGPEAGLGPLSGVCTSQTLSEQTNALVRVVCATGQFVSITALPNRRFLGVHGGAHRHVLHHSYASGVPVGGLPERQVGDVGAGTITTLRIHHVDSLDGPLELMIKF